MNRSKSPAKKGASAKKGAKGAKKKKPEEKKKLVPSEIPNSDVKLGGMGRCQFKPCKCPTFQKDATLTHAIYDTSSLCSRCEHAKMYHRLTPKDLAAKQKADAEEKEKVVEAKTVVVVNRFPCAVEDCDCEKFRLVPPAMQLILSPPQTSQEVKRPETQQQTGDSKPGQSQQSQGDSKAAASTVPPKSAGSELAPPWQETASPLPPSTPPASLGMTVTSSVSLSGSQKLGQTQGLNQSQNLGGQGQVPSTPQPPGSAGGLGLGSITLQALLAMPPSERPAQILCKCKHAEVYHYAGAKPDDKKRRYKPKPKKKQNEEDDDPLSP